MRRIAIVTARYGEEIVGGAERQARGFAETIAALPGWDMTVLSSCAQQQDAWQNVYAAGESSLNGVTVRRFPVTAHDRETHVRLTQRIEKNQKLPPEQLYTWLESGEQCEALYVWLAANSAEFDLILTLPYLSTVAHFAAWIAPEKTILWPCLHDELFAYLEPFRLLMESVYGVMFNSPEEAAFALETVGIRPKRHTVLGEGVLLETPVQSEPTSDVPYILYLGRLSAHKNLRLLYDFMERQHALDGTTLAIVGAGPFHSAEHPAFVNYGRVSEQTKADLVAGALAICQPSIMESFSLVIMEGWLAGRPALVNANSAVTVGHLNRAKAGLAFGTYAEFAAAIAWLRDHPDEAAQMGANGRDYVEANYRWPIVVQRLELTLATWEAAA